MLPTISRTPRHRSARSRSGLVLTLAALVSLGLGACSGSADEEKSATTSVATAPSPTSQPAGGRADLKGDCKATGDKWSFTGTLKNPEKTEQEYTILLAVAKTSGGTVVGSKEIKQKVAAGKESKVEAKDFLTHKPSGLQCVIRVTKAPVP